jgi:hypothetical protein
MYPAALQHALGQAKPGASAAPFLHKACEELSRALHSLSHLTSFSIILTDQEWHTALDSALMAAWPVLAGRLQNFKAHVQAGCVTALLALDPYTLNQALDVLDLEFGNVQRRGANVRPFLSRSKPELLAAWVRAAAGNVKSLRLFADATFDTELFARFLVDPGAPPASARLDTLELALPFFEAPNGLPALASFVGLYAHALHSLAVQPRFGHATVYAGLLDALPALPVLASLTVRVPSGEDAVLFDGKVDDAIEGTLRLLKRGAGSRDALRDVAITGIGLAPARFPQLVQNIQAAPGIPSLRKLRITLAKLAPDLLLGTLRGLEGLYPIEELALAFPGWPLGDQPSDTSRLWHGTADDARQKLGGNASAWIVQRLRLEMKWTAADAEQMDMHQRLETYGAVLPAVEHLDLVYLGR